MAKVRFSISMDADVAARIKAAAARAGQTVSEYVSRATLAAAEHDEHVADESYRDIAAGITLLERRLNGDAPAAETIIIATG